MYSQSFLQLFCGTQEITNKKIDKSHKGYLSLLKMKNIADRVDERDKKNEGSENVAVEYDKL